MFTKILAAYGVLMLASQVLLFAAVAAKSFQERRHALNHPPEDARARYMAPLN